MHRATGACESCKAKAPIARVILRYNLGMVVQRRAVVLDADLCRRCIRGHFWHFTLATLGLGWWGVFSFVFTLQALPSNVYWFLTTRDLPEAAPGPVVVDHYRPLLKIYGFLFTAFGGVCALIAAGSEGADRTQIAPGAVLLLPGLAMIATLAMRRGRAAAV